MFDQYQVDLVVNGHNHIYERTDPIKAGAPTTNAPIGTTITPASQGTTYVTAGGAGKSLYTFASADTYEGAVNNVSIISSYVNVAADAQQTETVTWSQVRYTGYCLLVGQVTPRGFGGRTTLTVRGLNENGIEIDRFTLLRSGSSAPWGR